MTSKTKVWKKRKHDYGWVTVTNVSYKCRHTSGSRILNSFGDNNPSLPDTDLNGDNPNTSSVLANRKGDFTDNYI